MLESLLPHLPSIIAGFVALMSALVLAKNKQKQELDSMREEVLKSVKAEHAAIRKELDISRHEIERVTEQSRYHEMERLKYQRKLNLLISELATRGLLDNEEIRKIIEL